MILLGGAYKSVLIMQRANIYDILTHTCLGQIEKVDKLPVSADSIVSYIVRVFENKSLWASEVNVVQLEKR
jgi:hypothetical protein